MNKKKHKARTVRFNQQDLEALQKVREIYGLTSDNEAIRVALRLAAGSMPPTHPA